MIRLVIRLETTVLSRGKDVEELSHNKGHRILCFTYSLGVNVTDCNVQLVKIGLFLFPMGMAPDFLSEMAETMTQNKLVSFLFCYSCSVRYLDYIKACSVLSANSLYLTPVFVVIECAACEIFLNGCAEKGIEMGELIISIQVNALRNSL
ncbi:hypothetical protein L2E82_02162 [Cichorium intybus]|uniref:Uncharacterized protein n=1 Tax=Cichorium intybus TaxID=13427 RepID=A0ACB9H0I5_CICIN|nr:hypothetical protein L2E82_02162 [Cichorium intybus]